MLDKGYDINEVYRDGSTPLMKASTNKDSEFIPALIDAGAAVNATNIFSESPLFYAIFSDSADNLKTLLKKGAKVNHRKNDGMTALHFAAQNVANTDIHKTLLNAGAKIDIQDNEGDTPIFLAVKANNQPVVSFLAKKGANINIANNKQQRPLPESLITQDKMQMAFLLASEAKQINPCDSLMYMIKTESNKTKYIQKWLDNKCSRYAYFGIDMNTIIRIAGVPTSSYKAGNTEVLLYSETNSRNVPLQATTSTSGGVCSTNTTFNNTYKSSNATTYCSPTYSDTTFSGGYSILNTTNLTLIFEKSILVDMNISSRFNTF